MRSNFQPKENGQTKTNSNYCSASSTESNLSLLVETHMMYSSFIYCEVITHSFDGQSWFNFKNYAHMLLNYIYDIDGYHIFLLISYQHSLQYDSPYYGRWNGWIIEPLVVSGYVSYRLQWKWEILIVLFLANIHLYPSTYEFYPLIIVSVSINT